MNETEETTNEPVQTKFLSVFVFDVGTIKRIKVVSQGVVTVSVKDAKLQRIILAEKLVGLK